jgi:hypothetical protein
MAVLSEADRLRIWRGIMRYWSNIWEATDISGPDLKAAVNATDQWIDDNQVSYNQALPSAAQSGLTQAQKVLLFCGVALARVDIPALRCLFGEVD